MRYVDADKLIAHLKDVMKACHLPFGSRKSGKGIAYGTILGLKSAISFAATLATADVVPKSEVAEIIEETFKRIRENFVNTPICNVALSDLEAELKKKYTESDSDENKISQP